MPSQQRNANTFIIENKGTLSATEEKRRLESGRKGVDRNTNEIERCWMSTSIVVLAIEAVLRRVGRFRARVDRRTMDEYLSEYQPDKSMDTR